MDSKTYESNNQNAYPRYFHNDLKFLSRRLPRDTKNSTTLLDKALKAFTKRHMKGEEKGRFLNIVVGKFSWV